MVAYGFHCDTGDKVKCGCKILTEEIQKNTWKLWDCQNHALFCIVMNCPAL